jgi:hypothetical protein
MPNGVSPAASTGSPVQRSESALSKSSETDVRGRSRLPAVVRVHGSRVHQVPASEALSNQWVFEEDSRKWKRSLRPGTDGAAAATRNATLRWQQHLKSVRFDPSQARHVSTMSAVEMAMLKKLCTVELTSASRGGGEGGVQEPWLMWGVVAPQGMLDEVVDHVTIPTDEFKERKSFMGLFQKKPVEEVQGAYCGEIAVCVQCLTKNARIRPGRVRQSAAGHSIRHRIPDAFGDIQLDRLLEATRDLSGGNISQGGIHIARQEAARTLYHGVHL